MLRVRKNDRLTILINKTTKRNLDRMAAIQCKSMGGLVGELIDKALVSYQKAQSKAVAGRSDGQKSLKKGK